MGQTASREDEEARGGLEKRRAPCAKCRAGLNDPAQRSLGTCHLAQLAVHPDSCKRFRGSDSKDLPAGTLQARPFGLSGVEGSVGGCGKDGPEHAGGSGAHRASGWLCEEVGSM